MLLEQLTGILDGYLETIFTSYGRSMERGSSELMGSKPNLHY